MTDSEIEFSNSNPVYLVSPTIEYSRVYKWKDKVLCRYDSTSVQLGNRQCHVLLVGNSRLFIFWPPVWVSEQINIKDLDTLLNGKDTTWLLAPALGLASSQERSQQSCGLHLFWGPHIFSVDQKMTLRIFLQFLSMLIPFVLMALTLKLLVMTCHYCWPHLWVGGNSVCVWADKSQGLYQIRCHPGQLSMVAICIRKRKKHNFLRHWRLPMCPTLRKSKMEGNAIE